MDKEDFFALICASSEIKVSNNSMWCVVSFLWYVVSFLTIIKAVVLQTISEPQTNRYQSTADIVIMLFISYHKM
jgi:hypothetical protein